MNSDIDVLIFSTIQIPYKKWVIKEIKKRLPSFSKTLEKFKQFKARILATNVATSAAALRTEKNQLDVLWIDNYYIAPILTNKLHLPIYL